MPDLDGVTGLYLASTVGGRVHIDADLRLHVESGPGASTAATVRGRGHHIRIDADRPEVLFSASNRADLGRVAELLVAAGITTEVFGPDGPVATIDARRPSRLGQVLTGSFWIAPAPAAVLRVLLTTPRYRAVAAGVGVSLVAASAWAARATTRRRRR